MAGVTVDSGPPAPEFPNRETPRERWPELISLRRDFLAVNLRHDCRCLVMFVREADEMWGPLGYADRDDLLARGYDLVPEEIDLAVRWLELNDPEYAIGIEEVKSEIEADASARSKKAAEATTGTVLPRGGDKRSEAARSTGNLPVDPAQPARAESAGISERQQRKLDALARKAPDKLIEVQRGEKSVHRACIEAGIVKVPTPLETILRLLPRLDHADLVLLQHSLTERLESLS